MSLTKTAVLSPPPPRPQPQPFLGNSGAQPIDLTGMDNDDEDDDLPVPGAKRPRANETAASLFPQLSSRADHLMSTNHISHINIPSIAPLSQPLPNQGAWTSQMTPQSFYARSWSSQPTPGQLQHQLNALHRAQSVPFNPGRPQHVTPTPPPVQLVNKNPANIIDLTRDLSPALTNLSSQQQQQQHGALRQTLVLDESLPPTTAILIGQINVSALVLNPVPHIMQQQSRSVLPNGQFQPSSGAEYVPVKLRMASDNQDAQDIRIYTPSQIRNGNVLAPDNFAVVESKVASRLRPFMLRRAIKLEAMIRTVQPGINILVAPLVVLVFTAKGNVSQVADSFLKSGLILERPSTMWAPVLTNINIIYHNPHHGQSVPAPTLNTAPRYPTPSVATKNVEFQRSAADAVFQRLRSEEDLPETSPGINISTSLYPHQKKALSFLLEREQELVLGANGKATSLWQCNGSGWQNSVTQEIVYSKPEECKGALLADDMGLGKTLETLCLLAYTKDRAQEFASQPLEPLALPEPTEDEPTIDQFLGSAWEMPNIKKLSITKEMKKAMHDKALAKYNRMSRIKEKTRATLIVCPLSTIVSWEDQLKDHWGGDVTIVGGIGSGVPPSVAPSSSSAAPSMLGDASSDIFMTSESRASEAPPSAQPSRQSSPVGATGSSNKRGDPIRVYVYHGASRRCDPQFISKFDIVITTYSTLSSEYSKQMRSVNPDQDDEDGISSDSGLVETDEFGNPLAAKKQASKSRRKRAFTPGDCCSPLQAIYWFRVVLDEAHFIKEPSTVASRACCDLIADRRLCLTGTPLQNKVDDVYALIKFLRVKPFDDKATWNAMIGSLVKYNQPLGFTRLQTIMRLLALRRTKETKGSDGKPILSLPPREDRMVILELEEEERKVYDSFFDASQAEFMSMAKADVMKNYVNILQKILRLRQICDDVELVKASKDGIRYDCAAEYEEAIKGIENDGINLERASAIFALMRDTSTAQCVECGVELATTPTDGGPDAILEGQEATVPPKRGRKPKLTPPAASTAGTRNPSPTPTYHPIVTRCTHLFCLCCFRTKVCPSWPCVPADARGVCSVCLLELVPSVDAVQVQADGTDRKRKESFMTSTTAAAGGNSNNATAGGRKVRRTRGEPIANFKPSTKVKVLLQELMPFSKQNPYSVNYDPLAEPDEILEVDEHGRRINSSVVKSVVFSQWTSMLDKIEEALETAGIHYERLDGGMKREERNRSLDALKNDPKCEVLLVSLKAGGVGLTLTAARRVYLMDPYWNPAVENQAVDRIHRLGQVNPVVATKFIIENSIEQRLLQVQQKKADLAKLTLGKPLSKEELQRRRLEELQNLLGAGQSAGGPL
ncbi:hypothetical protein FRC18_005455 [Serendipita sp. 400]|nr:hypothetical protein FRC18_005455 [Serendipita sp. 400]